MTVLLPEAGFKVLKVLSTLRQEPERVANVEFPQEGYSPDASFTVIVAEKERGEPESKKVADESI
ncbi:hypothetical protein ACFLWN_04775 [Chloroflexota bacterium]